MKLGSLILSLGLVLGGLAGEVPRWITIMPLANEGQEVVSRDVRALAQGTIVDGVGFSCTLVPEGDPAVDKMALLAPRFQKMRTLLKGTKISQGILLQATIGHGWKPDSVTPWQQVVNRQGVIPRYKFCPLDTNLLVYIAHQAKQIAALKPDFFMVDDDTRLITGIDGCFCPLHLLEMGKKTGRTWTRTELVRALAQDVSVRETWDGLLRESIEGLARIIRANIPHEIPGLFCCCADDSHHAGAIAKILASPGQNPVVRINNACYNSEIRRAFPNYLMKTAGQIHDLPKGTIVLDEADTCPQVRYSLSGTELIHHMVMNAFEGCAGAKIWITRLGNPHEGSSGKAYRELFRQNKGYMEKACALALTREGVRMPLPAPRASQACAGEGIKNWFTSYFGRAGFATVAGTAKPTDVVALKGTEIARYSNEELQQMLSGRVLLDGEAALELTKRGFAPLLGVTAMPWQKAPISAEKFETKTLWGGVHAATDLSQTNASAQVLSTLWHRLSGVSTETSFLAPGAVYFENEKGGRVVTLAAFLPDKPDLNGRFSFFNETRKYELEKMIRRLTGGTIPGGVVYPGDAEILLETGRTPAGEKIVVVDNLGLDTLDKLPLTFDQVPVGIKRLEADGSWVGVPFVRTGQTITLTTRVETMRPVVLSLVLNTPSEAVPSDGV